MNAKHLLLALAAIPSIASAQEVNPAYQHEIPDKVFEMGVPLVFIIMFFYTITAVLRIITENKTRQRLIDKGVSDEALKQMLVNGSTRMKTETRKWALVILFTGIGLFICKFLPFGYETFAVLCISISVGLLLSLISKKD